MSNPRDDERRKFEVAALKVRAARTTWLQQHGVPISPEFANFAEAVGELVELAEARAEQAETPQTREQLEKEWLAQTEWQDFTNWLIHVKLGYVSVENCPGPSCTVCGATMQPKVEFKCLSCGSTPAPTEPSQTVEPFPQAWRTKIAEEIGYLLQLHIEDTGEFPNARTFEDMCYAAKDQATHGAAALVEDRPAPTPEKCNCDAYDYAGMKHKRDCPFYKTEVAPEKE